MDHSVISPWTRWTPAQIRELKQLASSKTLFKREIAEKIGRSPQQVGYMLRRCGIQYRPLERYGKWNSKHSHLREPVMRYFLTHTWDETRECFGLTQSELKSLFTYGYRDPKLRHLRKETRRHDAWSVSEKRFLIQYAGIQPRKWIAKKLKRGGLHSVKEELSRLQMNSKFTNGMPRKYMIQVLGPDCPEGIKCKAGPTGGGRGDFRFVIIPWVECEKLLKRYPKRFDPEIRSAIRGMAMFQRWIFGLKNDASIVRRIKSAAGER